MQGSYLSYCHHNPQNPVWVRKDLQGKHREHCLCWSCGSFTPDNHEGNCEVANVLFAICSAFDIVTPVWECPFFTLSRDAPGGVQE